MANSQKVYIAYTGGTIGMKKTPNGYAPEAGYLAGLMGEISDLRDPAIPHYTIHEYDPLLDSANIQPSDWNALAQDIAAHYDDYDGFVVLHGTDTMGYSASALAFMLEGLGKPVVFTGAQIPLCEIRSDARENLVTAMLIAANYRIPEVCLYFGSKLLRGCRTSKVHASGFDAFDSPNYPPLGDAGIYIDINWDAVQAPPPTTPLKVQPIGGHLLAALRVFPGISADLVEYVAQSPLKGLVLEAYGVGNAPTRNADFLAALQRAHERGVVIVDCSQCLRGRVDLGSYATGSSLADAGVVSGYDMTTEAALAKLYYLFSAGYSAAQVEMLMGQNLRGELTVSVD